MNHSDSIERRLANELFRFKKSQLDRVLSTEVDRIEIASALLSIYRKLKKREPKIHFATGPCEAMEKVAQLMGRKQTQADLSTDQISSELSSVPLRRELDRWIFTDLKTAKAGVKGKLGEAVFREIVNILFRDFNFQLSQAIYYQVEHALSVTDKRGSVGFNPHPSFADWDWVSFYSGCADVMGIPNEKFADFERLLAGGFYSGFFYEDFCVVVLKPKCFRRNENLVLHDEDAPAVEWEDGTKLCFWNGINVPERLICDPGSVTADDILKESNAEVRRCFQEKLGSERFGSLLGLIELDRKSDRFGNESILFRTKTRDKLAGDYIYFAKVVCPSTGRSYFLCVPPWMKGVEEAVSWTFGKTPGEYKPILET